MNFVCFLYQIKSEKKTYFELRIDDDDRCGWSSISDEDDEEIEAEIVPIKLAIIIMLANQMNVI